MMLPRGSCNSGHCRQKELKGNGIRRKEMLISVGGTRMIFEDIALPFSLSGQQPNLLALAASAAAIVVMAFTSLKIARRTPARANTSGNTEVPSQAEPNSNTNFLRIIFSVLLAFCCVGLLILSIGISVGFATVDDVWEFMKIAVPAEALALSYYHVIKSR
jgi:hypothetical protein